jgi:hypothetical protein
MARLNVALMFNVLGQTLNHRVIQGRPTAATFQVFRNYAVDEGTAEFSGSATIDSVNTTVNVASGAAQTDPQKISLASTAGIVTGRKYLLSEVSLQEWLEPMEVQPTYIRVRFPLANNYTTAALFQSTVISAAVDATFIQTLGKVSDLDRQMVGLPRALGGHDRAPPTTSSTRSSTSRASSSRASRRHRRSRTRARPACTIRFRSSTSPQDGPPARSIRRGARFARTSRAMQHRHRRAPR